MKWFSKIIFLLLFIMAINPIVSFAEQPWETYDYSRFNNSQYVYDNGNYLSTIAIEKYENIFKDIKAQYGITCTFIIADDYDGPADELADYIWENGKYNRDYISIVVAMKSRDVSLYTYGKGIDIVSDMYVDGILDIVQPHLTNQNYDAAIADFADLAEKMIIGYQNNANSITTNAGVTVDRTTSVKKSFDIKSVLLYALAGGLVLLALKTNKQFKKHRQVQSANNADIYRTSNGANMVINEDRFLRSRTTRVKIKQNSSGGSTYSGSSGRSHGGGSRRF